MTDAEYWNKKWTDNPNMKVNNFALRAYRRIQAKNLTTLLDLGCGTGQDARYFAAKGLQVTALDLTSGSLERLSKQDSRINCLQRDICHLNLSAESFDVVYAHLSLQYFDDAQTRRIFEDIFNVLTPGGLFFVKCKSTTDRLFGEGQKVGENMFFKEHFRHFFSKEYMAEMLQPFKVISLRKNSSIYGQSRSSFIEAAASKD